MKSLNFKNHYIWLLIIISLAILLRFSGIFWGMPFNFHPDEWNMAAAITRLSFANKLDPKFYAYNQFPLYLTFFTASLYNLIPWIKSSTINVAEAIFFLRFWSAIASVGSVYFIYLVSKLLLLNNYSLLAALLATFTPGLIQIAHFGTTESLLSFFFLAIIYFSLKIIEKPLWKNFFWAGFFSALAMATKISALIFLVPMFLATLISLFRSKKKLLISIKFLVFIAVSLVFTFIFSPYLLLNFQESIRIISYETRVAQGIIPVFYTRQFFNTVPILFQLRKIFPYALGFPIFIFGMLGFFYMLFTLVKLSIKKKFSNLKSCLYLLIFAFLSYFLTQAFLFCKWTRFMAPIFAFFPIFAVFFFQKIVSRTKNIKLLTVMSFTFTSFCIIPGIIFSTMYFQPDIRFITSEWIYKNIPSGSKVLSETGNVIDIPILPQNYPNHNLLTANYSLSPISFDFYNLDKDQELFQKLLDYLENSDYIFIPSRRIFTNHLALKKEYPKTARYYELLFSGKLGFTEVRKFQVLNDGNAEETWSVFDHPTIRIYKKTTPFTKAQYEKLFF